MRKRRLFWLGMGLAAGSILATRANQAAERLAAGPVTRGLGQRMRNVAAGIGEFGAELRTSMRARERELTEMIEQRTGVPMPTWGSVLSDGEGPYASRQTGAPGPAGRARGAGG